MSTHSDHTTRRSRPGFTIVEMIVVIGVVAALAGLLLPAIGRARAGSRKTEELSNIKQCFYAWSLYANQNNDAALPGYLDEDTQTQWNVTYRFPNHSDIPWDIAAPYPWRLAKFLENSHELLHGHADEADPDMSGDDLDEASEVANEPSFGYNAFYVGGWWEDDDSDASTPNRPRFSSARVVARSTTAAAEKRIVLFASSSALGPGLYRKWDNTLAGSHFVVPSTVAEEPIWYSGLGGSGGGGGGVTAGARTDDVSSLRVLEYDFDPEALGVPIGRHTKSVAVLWTDGSCDTQLPGALADQRLWIPRADSAGYTHPAYVPPEPDP